MIRIETLLQEPAIQAVGWALVHFLWQGALIGVLAGLSLRILRHGAADVRYVVAAIALSLMATMPIVTALQAWRSAALQRASDQAPAIVRLTPCSRDRAMRPARREGLFPSAHPRVARRQACVRAATASSAGCRSPCSRGWPVSCSWRCGSWAGGGGSSG